MVLTKTQEVVDKLKRMRETDGSLNLSAAEADALIAWVQSLVALVDSQSEAIDNIGRVRGSKEMFGLRR